MGVIFSRKKRLLKRFETPPESEEEPEEEEEEQAESEQSDREDSRPNTPSQKSSDSEHEKNDSDDEKDESEKNDSDDEKEESEKNDSDHSEKESTRSSSSSSKRSNSTQEKAEEEEQEEEQEEPVMVEDITLSYEEKVKKALMGDMNFSYPENVKVVRIFTSSTFTDTSVERNTLMERVYPRLKSYCQERGYDFQVVDMRWGVRDESTDDHMTTELCMRELRACQKLSTGPNFITFLGQKYGYRPFPAQIAASEFEKLLSVVDNEDDLQLLKHWFWRDDNAVPAKYLLQPITSLLPHYRDYGNKDLRKKASGEWWAAFERMQVVFRKAADKALNETSDRQKYHMSVTEDEIRRGIIITSNPSKHCFWFKRVISDLRQNIDSSAAGKFMDKANSSVDDNAQELLNVLREKDIPQVLPDTNIISYSVKWSDNGVDTSESEEHAQYIDKLCKDFYETLTRMIDSGIHDNESSDSRDSLAEETFQHALFCQKKCKSFHGRNEFLKASKKGLLTNEKHAIVLFGESGCGKTSIMAKVATKVKQWLKDKSAIVVLRFIGTSPDSSGIRSLLRSVCTQLCKATGQDTANIPEDMRSLKDFFEECLEKSAEDHPVVLVLDSLDQMSIDEGGRQMDWFPRRLPDNVYAILSTLPGQEYQALPSLRAFMPAECFLEVPKIPVNEAGTILDSWLKAGNRDLLPKQKDVVMDAFQKCPLPLFLKLAFDEASRWKSYTPDSETHLEVTIRDIIDDLFDKVERRHGKILVSNALAYITASKNGLTEPELEDLLSLDEEVLNDVYQYWTPPIRRLPPLLWIRIRSDIGDYLTERGADGTQVIFWYHRQFIEAARERYLTEVRTTKIHKNLSEYFLGTWSDGVKKPYVNKDGQEMSMDRLVAKQPLMFDTNEDRQIFNLRKLSELPFHLLHSDQLDKVREECLCNFEFMSAKLRGTSLQMLMSDFTPYLEERPEDDDVKLLHECLQLSAHSLSKDRKQLATQMIGRMFDFMKREEEHPDICKVLKQAYNSSITCFIPNRKCLTAPGGVLRTAIGLSETPGADVISMAKDNRTIVVTYPSSEGAVIKIIDCSSGRVVRKFTMQEPHEMYQTNFNQISQKDPDLLLLAGSYKIFILNTLTGQIIQEFQVNDDESFSYYPNAGNMVSFADDENMLVAICPDSLKVWQVKDGALLHRMPLQGVSTEDAMGVLSARGSLAVYNLRGKKTVHFVNLKIGKEVDKIKVSYPKRHQGEDVFIQEVNITALDQVVVVPSSLNNLKLYDISGNLIRELSTFKIQQGLNNRLQITDDGRKAVYADVYDICILDLNTGEVEKCLRSPIIRLHVYTRDGINVLTIGYDGILRVYDRRREEIDENQKDTVINEIQGGCKLADQITAVSSSFDHRHVLTTATVQLRNELHVWDALTGKKVCSLTKVMGHPNPVRMCTDTRGVGFIYDQKLPHYKVFNFAEGKIEKNLEGKACRRMNAFGFIDQTRMVSFSRGRRFVKVWNIDSGKVIQIVEFNEKRRFEEMLISNNGRMAVCSQASQITKHKDKELPLIAVDTTSFTHKILKYEGEQLSLVNARISDDGKYLVNLVQYSQPLLWDLSAGKLMYKLFDPAAYETATCVEVSGASMTAMTGGSGIKVWNIESGQVLRTITCPPVSELFVSPDGNVVISRSKDANTFDAWDTKTGKNLGSFTTDGNPNHIKAIGDRLALAVGETPNLMIVHLHRPEKAGKLSKVDLKSPYDGLPATYSVADFQEKPSAVDSMDKDKDNDNGDIA